MNATFYIAILPDWVSMQCIARGTSHRVTDGVLTSRYAASQPVALADQFKTNNE